MDAYTKQCEASLPYVADKIYKDFGIRVGILPYKGELDTRIGSLPRGVVIELYGEKSVGKTTVALSIVADLQKQNKNILYVDLDKTLFPYYTERMGISGDNIIVLNNPNPEEAMTGLIELVSSGAFDFVIVDSVYNIPHYVLTRCLNHLVTLLGKTRTTVMFLNQQYKSLSKTVTTGGDALKSFARLRLKIELKKKFKNVDGHYGNRVIIKSEKYRDDFVYMEQEYKIYFGRGIVRENKE